MLEDSLVASRPSARTRKPLTVLISAITHGGMVVTLILIPLFQTPILPQIASFDALRPPQVQVTRLVSAPPRDAAPRSAPPQAPAEMIAPTMIPREILVVNDAPVDTHGFVPSLNGTGGGNAFLKLFETGGPGIAPPPLPPSPPPKPPVAAIPELPPPALQAPVRIGGEVVRSNLEHQVLPIYPPLAIQVRVEGPVMLEALITREGVIDPARLRVISGHPMLVKAAQDAVKQWRYRPTLLNGEPVEIITTITVSFRLQ